MGRHLFPLVTITQNHQNLLKVDLLDWNNSSVAVLASIVMGVILIDF